MNSEKCAKWSKNLRKFHRFEIEKNRFKPNDTVLNYIKETEQNFSIPSYKRRKTLETLYSKQEISNLKLLGAEVKDPDYPELPPKRKFRHSSIATDHQPSLRRTSTTKPSRYEKSYSIFFKKSLENARIWEKKPGKTLENMALIKRAALLEQILAHTFNEKFQSITPTESNINYDIIVSIFKLLFPFEIADALKLKSKLIGTVPDSTCNYLGCNELSNGALLETEVQRDMNSLKLKPLTVAFNKCLPPHLRRGPQKENLRLKWLDYRLKHKDLETFAYVWKDILDLKTTRKFFCWMVERPDVALPPYLEKANMSTRSGRQSLLSADFSRKDLLEDTSFKNFHLNAPREDIEGKPVHSSTSQTSEILLTDSYILI